MSAKSPVSGARAPLRRNGRAMPEKTVEERNKEIVQRAYDLAGKGDVEALSAIRHHDYRVTLPAGSALGGSWTGEDANKARNRIFGSLGIDGVTPHDMIADGPHRVIAYTEPTGVDGDGKRWSMLMAEFFWIEDGK